MEASTATELVGFVERASAGLDTLEAKHWQDRIDAARTDLTAAFDRLIADQRWDDAIRLAAGLEKYWVMSGRLAEGRTWLERAIAAGNASDDRRAQGLFALGMLAFWQGEDDASRSAHREAIEAAQRAGAVNVEALALTGLGRLALRAGDIAEARSLCRQALRVAADATETRGRSSALHVLSVAAQMNGDLEEARDLMWQRLELERAAGALRLVSAECSNLSSVERQLGHLAEARGLALQALDIEVQQEDVWSMPYTFNQLAAIDAEAGDAQRAATLLAVASRMVEEQGAEWPPDEAPVFEQTRDVCIRELGDSAFQHAWVTGRTMSWRGAAAAVRSTS